MSHRIVIVGAGFAGLSAALELPDSCDVTVISDRPWCEFLPNIHEILSSQKRPEDLRIDASARVEEAGHRFVQDEVVEIDRGRRVVRGLSSGTHAYDGLIVAVGGVNATHGVSGADRWAMPFKSVADCEQIGTRLRALHRRSPRARVTVVGGGLEGVEALGEILRRVSPIPDPRRRSGVAPALCGSREPGRTVRKECAAFDVGFEMESRVDEVGRERVTLSSGVAVDSEVTIWTGGPTGAPLLNSAGLAPRAGAWAPVAATLESSDAEGVFLAGDAAALGEPIAKQAYHAMDMGVCAARNAMRRLDGRVLERFVPAEKPMLVSLGHLGCFLVQGRWALFGPGISMAKEAVFQLVTAQLAPPSGVDSTVAAWRRLSGAFPEPGWPSVPAVWNALRGALDVRVLAPEEGACTSSPNAP